MKSSIDVINYLVSLSETVRYILLLILSITVIFMLLFFSITQLDDDFSTAMRLSTQQTLNNSIVQLSKDTANNSLDTIDKSLLHLFALSGITISRFTYPEAATLLSHYIYGAGEDLELPSAYFKSSMYLQYKVKKLGYGLHGPLTLKQKEDWRLSMTFNPYFLKISKEKIRIFYPEIAFALPDEKNIYTIVPIGKLKLKVYDNIISALNPVPFYAYAQWSISETISCAQKRCIDH